MKVHTWQMCRLTAAREQRKWNKTQITTINPWHTKEMEQRRNKQERRVTERCSTFERRFSSAELEVFLATIHIRDYSTKRHFQGVQAQLTGDGYSCCGRC
jgi:hypothetical protein